jgi:putative ABC transport system substrate-binding protein
LQAFRQGLHDLGYVEGQNLVIEGRFAEGKADRLPELAAELVRLQVDVIVAAGIAAIRAAQHATRTLPIVMVVGGADPVAHGFVASLARPGGNITGMSAIHADLSGKRLELLQRTVPSVARIAVLMNPANPAHALQLRETQAAAQALGMQLQVLEARGREELESAFSAIHREGAGALFVFSDPLLFERHLSDIAALALQHRLPSIYAWRMWVEAGGLMSYAPSLPDIWRRTAYYVDRILKGTKPADLPVEQPMKFELVINHKTAQALGLTIPPTLLILADEVIQ